MSVLTFDDYLHRVESDEPERLVTLLRDTASRADNVGAVHTAQLLRLAASEIRRPGRLR